MRTSTTLYALVGLATIAASFSPAASAHDWFIGIDIGIPGYVVVPAPRYVRPPPAYYGPGYYQPGYYRPPVDDDYDRSWQRHHHHDDDDDDDDE